MMLEYIMSSSVEPPTEQEREEAAGPIAEVDRIHAGVLLSWAGRVAEASLQHQCSARADEGN